MSTVVKTPAPFKANAKHLKALKSLQEEQQALQAFLDHVVNQGQLKVQKLQTRGSEIWAEIARDHAIDIQNVAWAPNFQTGEILPIRINLMPQGPNVG